MPSLLKRISRNIRSFRRHAGLTQERIANRAGVTYRHYQAIEAGGVDLRISTLQNIARQLYTDPASLLMVNPYQSSVFNEEDVAQILELVPCGIQINDLKGVITYSNAAHRALHGYSPEEMIGKMAIWDLLASEGERDALKVYFRKLLTGKPKEISYYGVNRLKGGGTIPVRVKWRYLSNDAGNLRGFISCIEPVKRSANEGF